MGDFLKLFSNEQINSVGCDRAVASVTRLTQVSQLCSVVAWSADETLRHLPLPRRPKRAASPDRLPQHAAHARQERRGRSGDGLWD